MPRVPWLALLLFVPGALRAQPQAGATGVSSPSATAASLRAAVLAPPAAPRDGEFAVSSLPSGTSLPLRSFDRASDEDRPDDPWLAFDKAQHLAFSFLWTLGGQYALVNKAEWREGDALPVSAGVSAAVGLAKEYYDWRAGPRRYFSRRDLAADAAGIILAAGFILL